MKAFWMFYLVIGGTICALAAESIDHYIALNREAKEHAWSDAGIDPWPRWVWTATAIVVAVIITMGWPVMLYHDWNDRTRW